MKAKTDPRKIVLRDVRKSLPIRKREQNKSHGGRCLIVAGSPTFLGAAILSARAAARSGAGYVTLAVSKEKGPPSLGALVRSVFQNPDFLIRYMDSGFMREIGKLSNLSSYSAIAIGPGLGSSLKTRKQTWRLIKKLSERALDLPVVLDADALNAVAQFRRAPAPNFPSHWIMTPHEGELSRLLKVPVVKIKADRLKYVQKAQQVFGCIVVLKGANTLIASSSDSEFSIWKNTSGNSALAKAGTGDVLTGILVGLLSQKVPSLEATKLAVFLHGRIADRWIESGRDHLSLMASDLIEALPRALLHLRGAGRL